MIYIEGYHVTSLITPEQFAGTGANIIPRFTNVVAGMAAMDNNPATLQFDGTEEDGDAAVIQGPLDGTIEAGAKYRIHIRARQTGSGANVSSPAVALVDNRGQDKSVSFAFWGADSGRTLTGVYQDFSSDITMLNQDGEFTPSTFAMWMFAPLVATKRLEIDEVVIEQIPLS